MYLKKIMRIKKEVGQTLEFKLRPTKEQINMIEDWFEQSRLLWNFALNDIHTFERTYTFDKIAYELDKGKIKHLKQQLTNNEIEESVLKDFQESIKKKNYNVGVCQSYIKFKYSKDLVNYNDNCDNLIPAIYNDTSWKEGHIPYSSIVNYRSKSIIRECNVTTIKLHKENPKVKKTSGKNQFDYGWKGGYGYSCPLPVSYESESIINELSVKGLKELSVISKNQKLKDLLQEHISNVFVETGIKNIILNSNFRYGLLSKLEISYKEYLKSKYKTNSLNRGCPKFKSTNYPINSLYYVNKTRPNDRFAATYATGNTLKKVPGLKTLSVKGLYKRWGEQKIGTVNIVKKNNEYYVQLFGVLEKNIRIPNNKRIVGIDPGAKISLSLDNGKAYKNNNYLKRSEKTKIKLDKSKAHKLTHNLILFLNNPKTSIEDILNITPAISKENVEKLLNNNVKTEKDILDIISNISLNRLKYAIKSNRIKKLELKIKKKNELLASRRKTYDHKVTTYLCRTYSHISFEDTKIQKMVDKSKSKKTNKSQADLNKVVLDTTIGRKKELLKAKSKYHETKFHLSNAYNSSKKM